MSNLPISMLLAQSTGLTPEDRKKMQDLARQQAGQDAAAVGEEALALNPVFQPPEEQGFSLAGNAPVGGAGGIGSALLGNAPPTAPGTEQPGMEQPKRKRLEEMQSWERLQKQQAKYDKIPWFAPSQLKDRLSSDMGRTLDTLRLEMADAGGQQHDAQYYANLLSVTKRDERKHDLTAQQLKEAAEERRLRSERLEREFGLKSRTLDLKETDVAEGRQHRYKPAGGALYDTSSKEWIQPPAGAPGEEPWQRVFAKALPKLLENSPSDEELLRSRERYRSLLGPGEPPPEPTGEAQPRGGAERVFRRGKNGQLERVR